MQCLVQRLVADKAHHRPQHGQPHLHVAGVVAFDEMHHAVLAQLAQQGHALRGRVGQLVRQQRDHGLR
ncbi:hypothetical protein D3C71_2162470 [compost metagenome]